MRPLTPADRSAIIHTMHLRHLTFVARMGAILLAVWTISPALRAMTADRPSAGELQFSVFPATQKIFPETIPAGESSIKLRAARGEFISFQVAFRVIGEERTLPLALDFPGGEIFEVIFVDTPAIAQWGYPEEFREHRRPVYPDPLVKAEELTLSSGETKSLWVRLQAVDSGSWTLRAGESAVSISLEVWPFTMPRQRSLKTAVGLGGLGFARFYGLAQHSEEYWQMYSRYFDMLLDYRLSPYRVPYGERDQRARSYLLDERVTNFVLSYFGDPEEMSAYQRELSALGVWQKGYFHNIDEPTTLEEYTVAADQAAYLRRTCGEIRYALPFYTGLEDRSTPFDHLEAQVNLWMIQTDYYHHGHGLGDRIRRQARARVDAGDELWLYTALAPRGGWCNLLLNHTALEHRILFWQLFADPNVTGYLYWQSTYWDQVEDPWKDQATVKHLDPALWGDGSLVYPGPDGPLPSVRLELIRAGIQDYELLKKAEAALGRHVVMAEVRSVTESLVRFTDDPVLFEDVRRRIGDRLASHRRENEGQP